MNELTKAQILDLVTSLYNGEGARTRWGMDRIARNVPHPDISNLIFGRKRSDT